MTILFVTKDIGGFNAAKPVADLLRGIYSLIIVAEGQSKDKWLSAGYEVSESVENLGDLVVATLGSPINLEDKISRRANEEGVPLVWIEDVWGAHCRSKAMPYAICTLDFFGADLIRSKPDLKDVRVRCTGNPAFDYLISYLGKDKMGERKNIGLPADKKIVFFPGPGFTQDTLEILRFLKDSLRDNGDFVLVPRLHPKLQKLDPNGWDICQKEISETNCVFPLSSVITDDLIFCSDIVVSTYSTVLYTAASLRRLPVSFVSAGIKENMKMEIGLTRYPLVIKGCAIELNADRKIFFENILDFNFDFLSILKREQKSHIKLDGENAKRVANVIQEIVE